MQGLARRRRAAPAGTVQGNTDQPFQQAHAVRDLCCQNRCVSKGRGKTLTEMARLEIHLDFTYGIRRILLFLSQKLNQVGVAK